MAEVKVLPEDAGKRLDALISEKLPELSRSAAQRLIAEGKVLVNGAEISKSRKAEPGDTVEITIDPPKVTDILPQDIPLKIMYEDEDVIVINKPRGMVVHPAPGNEDGTLVNALLHYCGDSLSGIGGEIRPGIVHRIDKDTSGLLLVAKNDAAHTALSSQLQDKTLSRDYLAMVYGNIKDDSGRIEAPIGRSPKDRKKMSVVADGRNAATRYTVLERMKGFTLIRCSLETGRTHQIRVHMAHIGHPVAGDPLYGPKTDKTALGGQCLHAEKLKFVHPKTGEHVEVQCEIPDYFSDFIKKVRY